MPSKGKSQELRNRAMIEDATKGVTNQELAEKYGMSTTHVSRVLNHSDESRIIRYKIEKAFEQRIEKIMQALDRALEGDESNLHVAASSAFKMIERLAGKVPDKLEAQVGKLPENMSEDELIEQAEKKLAEIKAKRLK